MISKIGLMNASSSEQFDELLMTQNFETNIKPSDVPSDVPSIAPSSEPSSQQPYIHLAWWCAVP